MKLCISDFNLNGNIEKSRAFAQPQDGGDAGFEVF